MARDRAGGAGRRPRLANDMREADDTFTARERGFAPRRELRNNAGNNAMIIDCHAHVFQSWEGACGHPSSEIHRRYIQKVQTRTAARVYRARDGKQFSGQLLFKEGDNSWSRA